MQIPLGHCRINIIKYVEINISGEGEHDKIELLGCHIKRVPYIRFCTERQQPGRGQRLRRPTAHGPAAGWAKSGNQGGPDGRAESLVSPPLPFPSSQSHIPRPPKNPSPQREIIHSHGPLKVYRSLPALRAAGLCSHPSRPPIQNHEPEKPLNYNPHNAPRLSRSQREGCCPKASDWGRSMAVTLGAPLPALPLTVVSLGLITPVPEAGRLLVMWSRSGGVGVEPWPPLRCYGIR